MKIIYSTPDCHFLTYLIEDLRRYSRSCSVSFDISKCDGVGQSTTWLILQKMALAEMQQPFGVKRSTAAFTRYSLVDLI